MKTSITLLLSFGLLASGLFGGVAAKPAAELENTISSALDAIYGADTGEENTEARVRAAFEENFTLNVMVRRAIGRNWQKMSAQEQEDVVELITQLVVKALVRNLDGRTRPEIAFGEAVTITDKRIEVPSTAKADGKVYRIEYRLGRMKTGWEIYDIVAEDISIVANYRQQFDDHFRTKDCGALIARLEELLNTEDIGNEVKL